MRAEVSWETGELFGLLKAEKEFVVTTDKADAGKAPVDADVLAKLRDMGYASDSVTTESTAPDPRAVSDPIDMESEASVRSACARTKADMRSLAMAAEAYTVDYGVYPTSLPSLTTPIAYITRVPKDPFAPNQAPLTLKAQNKGYLIYSIGPDRKDDNGAIVFDSTNGTLSVGDIGRNQAGWLQ